MSVVALTLIGIALPFREKISDINRLENVVIDLKAKIAVLDTSIKELQTNQQKFSTDKNFVQKIGHETGYAHEGETIYQFEEPLTNSGTRNIQ
jgi:cell division protein FtsB